MISTFLYPMLSPAGCKKSDHRSTQKLKKNNNIYLFKSKNKRERNSQINITCSIRIHYQASMVYNE